jgi:hypothetical protein
MFKRFLSAFESIARSLDSIDQQMKEMRKEQKESVEAMKLEAANSPQKVREIVNMVQQLIPIGGRSDGH